MRIAPPTRASTSHTGLQNPFGPHHRASCFASVHARKTTSGVAGTLRVRLISISPSSTRLLPFAITALPRLHLAQIVVQFVEAAVPSTHMTVAISGSHEKRLAKLHRRLSAMLLERDRNHRLNIGRKAGVLVPPERVNQPLRL